MTVLVQDLLRDKRLFNYFYIITSSKWLPINFFGKVLQAWMARFDVYLQIKLSWSDKTWNMLRSSKNRNQSQFRDHWFYFLFPFPILTHYFWFGVVYIGKWCEEDIVINVWVTCYRCVPNCSNIVHVYCQALQPCWRPGPSKRTVDNHFFGLCIWVVHTPSVCVCVFQVAASNRKSFGSAGVRKSGQQGCLTCCMEDK